MEEDETFDAGRGAFSTVMAASSSTQHDGWSDASRRRCGLRGAHPKSHPRVKKVLHQSPHVYFVGTGAERFAQEHGIDLCSNEELIIPREMER